MGESARRAGLNEALFREVNERLEEISADTVSTHEAVDFVCECVRADCTDRIGLTVAEYEDVRADAAQFAVAPGHVAPEVEDVVASHDGYVVVRKRAPESVRVAARLDPRSTS
jgi:hypothetical protein